MFSARGGFFGSVAKATTYIIALTTNLYSSAIKSDGTLWIWGYNATGQLGTNDVARRSLPVQIGASSWAQIGSIGDDATLGITTAGTMFAWGIGSNGELGLNSTVNRSSPTQIGAATNWRYTALTNMEGSTNGGAINSLGQLFAWGRNDSGQLGINSTTVARSSPVQVAGSWTMANIGFYQSGGIKSDGTLWVWGNNATRQLTDGTSINRSSPVQILSGYTFSKVALFDGSSNNGGGAAIATDSTVWVWGENNYGALATGDTVDRSSPVQLSGSWTTISLSEQRGYGIKTNGTLWGWGRNDGFLGVNANLSWTQVSSGTSHTLGVRSDGSMWAWGTGQALGINQSIVTRSIPVQIGSDSWNQVSAGNQSSYAIKNDGSLWAWGANGSGQLGIGNTLNRSSPVQVSTSSWINISASKQSNFVLAIRNDNTVYGWGDNSYGSTGAGNVGAIINSPIQISGGGSFVSVSAGGGHAQAIDINNKLYGWGLNNAVQTGSVGNGFSWTFITASEPLGNTGGGVYAIKNDGSLWVWGNGANGQLGLGDTISRSSPVQLGTNSWISVNAGGPSSAFAIRQDGALFAWGFNSGGNLGDGTTITRSSPVQIGSSSWSQVSAGESHAFALKTTGELFSWGRNTNGVLGSWTPTATNGFRSSPVQVGSRIYTKIESGSFHGLAIDTASKLWVWGQNASGQLGLNLGVGGHRSQPVQLGTSNWTQVAAPNSSLSFGITELGRLFAWGANGNGVLGINDIVSRSSPVQIGSSSWTKISTTGRGQVAIYGITTIGRLFAWGTNSAGQLATNDTLNRSSPVQIGTATDWIYTGGGYGIRTSSGLLYGWGYGVDGQIGNSTTISRSSPVQIGFNAENPVYSPIPIGSSSWTSVSAGGSHSVAISSNGLLYAWGLNSSGQLGLNDISNRDSPTQVGTSSWTSISAGSNHCVGIEADNSVMAWGLNTSGQTAFFQLSNNATRSSPVQVSSFNSPNLPSNVSVVAGTLSSFYTDTIGQLWAWGDNTSYQLGTIGLGGVGEFDGIPGFVDNLSYITSPIQLGSLSWESIRATTNGSVLVYYGQTGGIGVTKATDPNIDPENDNILYVWGTNYYGSTSFGRIGIGSIYAVEPSPVVVTLA